MDDFEAIRQLKARYFRAMDTHDWALLRASFTDDFLLDATGTGGGVLSGASAVVDFITTVMEGTRSAHHGHMPEIDLANDGSASGTWALTDLVVFPDGTRMQGYGHYHDTYRKIDGHWRIARSTVTRLLVETDPPPMS